MPVRNQPERPLCNLFNKSYSAGPSGCSRFANAVDGREHDQQVRLDQSNHERRKIVIVSQCQFSANLLIRNDVILIDDRNNPIPDQVFNCPTGIGLSGFLLKISVGQQNLTNTAVRFREQLAVACHQLCLPNSGSHLEVRQCLRTRLHLEHLHAGRDSP